MNKLLFYLLFDFYMVQDKKNYDMCEKNIVYDFVECFEIALRRRKYFNLFSQKLDIFDRTSND